MAGSKFLENLIAGSSEKIQDVRKHIELAAPFPVSVMAVGPTGSGKELSQKAFTNCPGAAENSLPSTLLQSPPSFWKRNYLDMKRALSPGQIRGAKAK